MTSKISLGNDGNEFASDRYNRKFFSSKPSIREDDEGYSDDAFLEEYFDDATGEIISVVGKAMRASCM
ncbi:hypothetical protein KIN20_032431 [Parelaphostrongylus tenuis]|uniref:Uncharacterized protein n=1 Tax=Parelaphostrongylus tenuis TaxID=148309 RepID=A0AAD5R700_PARTN|nr:hypothetical protein KIN20_032431 [Parelaphostrongylus tenuis]